jgi:hypothetical protein
MNNTVVKKKGIVVVKGPDYFFLLLPFPRLRRRQQKSCWRRNSLSLALAFMIQNKQNSFKKGTFPYPQGFKPYGRKHRKPVFRATQTGDRKDNKGLVTLTNKR